MFSYPHKFTDGEKHDMYRGIHGTNTLEPNVEVIYVQMTKGWMSRRRGVTHYSSRRRRRNFQSEFHRVLSWLHAYMIIRFENHNSSQWKWEIFDPFAQLHAEARVQRACI